MSITEQANRIRDAIADWLRQYNGVVTVAFDVKQMYEQAAVKVDSPVVVVCYNGEKIRGSFDVAAVGGRVDRSWMVLIRRGRSMGVSQGNSLSQTQGNAKAFYDQVEELRNGLRAMLNVSDELPVDYRGIRPVFTGTQNPLDAYIIDFTTAVQLPLPQPKPAPAPLDEPTTQTLT